MKRNRLLSFVLVMMLAVSGLTACSGSSQTSTTSSTEEEVKKLTVADLDEICSKIDTEAIIANTDEISQIGATEDGFCIAGSESDPVEAKRIEEIMTDVGLTDVREDKFTCDGWDYSKLTLKVTAPEEKDLEVGPFAGSIGTEGKDLNAEVVYVGYGTYDEIKKADVKGKIILAEFDLLYDYWPSMVVEEAEKQGAVGLIHFYSDTNPIFDDVRGSFDTQSELYFPIVTVSKDTGKYLKELCKKGKTEVTLNSDAHVIKDAESCNVVGCIKGKTDKNIVIGGHRDHFWKPFSDDTLGVTTAIGIAKTLIDAGYQPNCNLLFVAFGAEEYGITCTRYDWAYGSYHFIKNNPDIIDNTILCLNIDNYLSDHDSKNYNYRPDTSLMSYCTNAIEEIGGVPEIFSDGVVYQDGANSFFDSYGFNTVGGIPSMEAAKRPFPEGENSNYHTLYDNTEHYTGTEKDKALTVETIEFTIKSYIKWLLEFDSKAVTEFDFSYDMGLLLDSMDTEVMKAFGIDYEEAVASAEQLKTKAADYYKALTELNDAADANEEKKAEMADSFDQINKGTYEIYDKITKTCYILDIWDGNAMAEDKILGNLTHLKAAKDAVDKGDEKAAVSELGSVDISYYFGMFEKDVIQKWYFDALDETKSELYWAKGKTIPHVDCYDIYNELTSGKYDQKKVSAELQKLIDEQVENCNKRLSEQNEALQNAIKILDTDAVNDLVTELK